MTWPTLRHPATTIPQDIYDPVLQAWQMAWSGHALTTNPLQLWQANAFYPDRYSFAFSDTLLGYAPLGLIGSGPEAALIRYNLAYVLLHALGFVGAYALLRQLGARWPGALAGAIAFAYAPWRLGQAGHMHVLSTGGIVLALAMLARGHGWSLRDGYRPERARPGWAFAGWAVAAWQISLGFGIGLPFAYLLAVIGIVAFVQWLRLKRPKLGRRLVGADIAGGLLVAATGVLLAYPYFKVVAEHPYARRTPDWIPLFSPPLRGFVTAPAESWLWGSVHAGARVDLQGQPETVLLPGFALIGLAAAGLFVSAWSVRQRLWLAAGVAGSVALAMGTQFLNGAVYLTMFKLLPGWDSIRTPGRLVIYTTIFLAILAAGLLSAPRLGRLKPIGLVAAGLILIEGLNVTPHPTVPVQPAAMRQAAGPILLLPSDQLIDNGVMLWSTDRFPKIVNGNSGFTPRRQEETRAATATFPDQGSVDYLRKLGVKTVIVAPDLASYDTRWRLNPEAPLDGLGLTRTKVGRDYVFTLN